MTKEELQILYKEKILPENRNPFHFEKPFESQITLQAFNPVCGDKFELFADIESNIFTSVHFYGFGCAISKASTSFLLRQIDGKSIQEAAGICSNFLGVLENEGPSNLVNKELKVLSGLKNFEVRLDCVRLSWEALFNYLNEIE